MWSDIDMIEVHTISSTHLTTAQCDLLKYIVGRRREIRAAGVVEVLTADVTDAGSRTWAHKGYGVICFIKDHPGKRYIFKAYNLMTRKEIHEHTINNKFKYIQKSDQFHYMTGAKNRMTGLNFIDETEAKLFKETVDRKREQWIFPSVPPHPRGLPDYIPPHISLQEIIQELPQDVPTQAPTQVPTPTPTQVPTQTPTQVPTLVPGDISSRTPQEIFSQTPQDLLTQVPQDILTQTPQDLLTRVPQEVPSQIQSQGTEQDLTSHVSQEITSQVLQDMTSQVSEQITSQATQKVQSHVPLQPMEQDDGVDCSADTATQDRLDAAVTERQLMTLSTAFGDNWQFLSIHLGISDCRREQLTGDNNNTIQQKIYSILKEWVRINAEKATSRVLFDAISSLRDAGVVTVDMDVVHKACNFKEEDL